MSSLKSLLFLAFLGAAACGVYVMLNRNTESPVPPGISEGAPGGPVPLKIEMPAEGPPGLPAAAPGAVAPGSAPPVAPGLPSPSAAVPPAAIAGLPAMPGGPMPNTSPAPPAPASNAAAPPPAAADSAAAVSLPAARDNTAALKAAVKAKLDQDRVAEAHLLLSLALRQPGPAARRGPGGDAHAGPDGRDGDLLAAALARSRPTGFKPATRWTRLPRTTTCRRSCWRGSTAFATRRI